MSAGSRVLGGFTIVAAVFAAPLAGQNFGSTAAFSGGDVVVGQPANFYGPGAVYLYRASEGWDRTARLEAADATLGDRFGRSVAATDGQLLIGGGALNAPGAVYVFGRDASAAGGWAAGPTLNDPSGDADAGFGAAVALAGTVGFVGAPGAETTGLVYEVSTADGGLAISATLRPTSLTESAFGASLSAEGDLLLIGAPAASSGAGAAVVFRRAEGGWVEEALLTGDGVAGRRARLGSDVLLDGGRALVGAPLGANGTGTVLVFERAGDEWRMTSQLEAEDAGRGGRFGSALAATDGEVWVGAPNDGGGDGVVYRFATGDGAWSTVGHLVADSANTAAWPFGFGSSVAIGGDVAVVGMPRRDFGEGRAAILTASTGDEWEETATPFEEIATAVSAIAEGADCEGGSVEVFECSNMEVVSFTPVSELGGERGVWVNDVWGWSDPETGRDYAIVARRDGAAFVDLTNPAQPHLMGSLPRTAGSRPSVWRDIKVVNNHAFIVSDGAGAHGMQVFDLTRLRSVTDAPVTFTEDAHYDRVFSAHNVVADTASEFLYIVGASGGGETCGGGLHMVDASNPKSPTFAGCYNDATGERARGYTHDAQCMVYRGPDERYQGRQICVGSNEVEINIADVTDKDAPVVIGRSSYPNVAYAHQGWFDESQRYFYMGDEGDEVAGLADRTRTLVWDLEKLDDPILAREYFGPVAATDHNLFIRDDRAYMSNYGSGLRVLDISDPANPHEIAFFDSAPRGNNEAGMSAGQSGAWSNYPFFESGLVVFTSVREGLFVVRVKPRELVP